MRRPIDLLTTERMFADFERAYREKLQAVDDSDKFGLAEMTVALVSNQIFVALARRVLGLPEGNEIACPLRELWNGICDRYGAERYKFPLNDCATEG